MRLVEAMLGGLQKERGDKIKCGRVFFLITLMISLGPSHVRWMRPHWPHWAQV